MYIDNDEAAYLVTRIDVSQAMARSARGPCARHAHEEFATRYQDRLTSLLRDVPRLEPIFGLAETDHSPFADMAFLHRSAVRVGR